MLHEGLTFVCDNYRHLVCLPYSKDNLHRMAGILGLKRHWFHKDHYDIPVKRQAEITAKCRVVRPRIILAIISGELRAS